MNRMTLWIDSHCHLDAPEFGVDVLAVRARAQQAGVRLCVIPAVAAAHFESVRSLAHSSGDGYALGIHPLFVERAVDADLAQLDATLLRHRDDPRLVAVGEIGLDFFVPELKLSPLRERQEYFYREQLKLARQHGLPVILHVRRSADRLLKYLRELAPFEGWRGIAHAFNGSQQQAEAFIGLGFKLGFGGAVTFEAARQIRQLATSLPLDALVLETDAPDMPPHWLYQTAQTRAEGAAQGRNEPAELPRIAQVLADLRGISADDLALASTANALVALPRLQGLLK
jgi:TatD DNase family protein